MIAGHAEALAPMVERILVKGEIVPGALDRIAVTIGPGTFTGLRVGLAFARALGLALRRPVFGVTTLAAIGDGARAQEPGAAIAIAAIDARRGELYLQAFDASGGELMPPSLVPVNAVAKALEGALARPGLVALGGTGVDILIEAMPSLGPRALPTRVRQPEARHVASRGAAMPQDPLAAPEPLYLRAPDAKLPSERKRRPPRGHP